MGIKWGIIGTANIARWGMIPGMKKAKDCELYAIAGRSLEKAKAFKEEYGFEKYYGSYEELVNDPEVQAVYVPLPNHIHLEWVKKSLKAGKHVLCEKPLAMNAKEAEEMFATAKENGVVLMEAYAYLHSPFILSLQKDIKDGLIGNVDYIDTAFVTQGYKEDFRLHKEFGGGAMYDLGCYCTTMILSIVDAASANGYKEKIDYIKADAELTENKVDMLTAGLIKFANGTRASFNVGMNLGVNTNSRYDRLFIHGDKGSIRSEVEYNQEGTIRYTIYSDGKEIVKTVEAPNNYAMEVENMNDCVKGTGMAHIPGDFSVINARIIDEVLKKIGM